jgi:hypothetical protein
MQREIEIGRKREIENWKRRQSELSGATTVKWTNNVLRISRLQNTAGYGTK